MIGAAAKVIAGAGNRGGSSESGAWSLANVTYIGFGDVGTQNSILSDAMVGDSGTLLYSMGAGTNGDEINQYAITTPYDPSSGLTYQKTLNLSGGSPTASPPDNYPQSFTFSPDGTELYVLSNNAQRYINQYTLSTAWDIATAIYYGKQFDITSTGTNPRGVYVRADGLKLYFTNSATIYEYSLSPAWDVSSASLDNSQSLSGLDAIATLLSFNPDGTKVFLDGGLANEVIEAAVETAWDVTTIAGTATYTHDYSGQEASVLNGSFRQDGNGFYLAGNANDYVYYYTTP